MTLRSVAELAASPEGRERLEELGVHTDAERFRSALRPPKRPDLARALGLAEDRPLIYGGQQIAADYTHGTAAKFVAMRELATSGVDAAILWHDMDRTGSDRYALRVVLEMGGSRKGLWLASRKLEDREPRFIAADRERIDELFRQATNATDGLPRELRTRARTHLEQLEGAVRDAEPSTLAGVARALTEVLLYEQLGLRAPSLWVSELAAGGLLREPLLRVLATLDEVVAVFNAEIEKLAGAGIDPQVRPLDDRYLPLWFSCPETGRRLRLEREQDGARRFGVASCSCGKEHRFDLGDGVPSLDELEATGRWSPDVLLPALHDDLASGYVAGRSTALYGIVMRAVIGGPLGGEPTPAYLPPGLMQAAPEPDSILHAYLVG